MAPTPLCLDTNFDGDFKIQDTIPKVRVPRHKPASDLEHGVVISADDDLQDVENIPVMGMSPIAWRWLRAGIE